ncbi:hypothetical protein DMH26_03480 [Streptomyces sp. WAC 05379]|nr:hypothetical protein DMH26_03480 [Streptomyces sp. WAC 05379]
MQGPLRFVLTADTLFLLSFPGGWVITAAGCVRRSTSPTSTRSRAGERTMRALFTLLLLTVGVGLAYFTAVGLTRR